MLWRTAGVIVLVAVGWTNFRSYQRSQVTPGDLGIEEKLRLHGIPGPVGLDVLSYARNDEYAGLRRKQIQPSGLEADTTAVILNWSRLENVVLIVAALCRGQLDDVISQIFVWNNNPNVTLSHETFYHSNCSHEKLRIYNSPENLYFQARFMACQESSTPLCFIQDDDYLIHPEIIRNMHDFLVLENFPHPVHLLPPEEHLRSRMRTVTTQDGTVSTSFAWLGHGTYLRREIVIGFMSTLHRLNTSKEEKEMADNYFPIFYNRIAEIWFDHSISLGGGQPFTVGSEGDDRNIRHILNALRYLRRSIAGAGTDKVGPSHKTTPSQERAPCRSMACLIQTNISFIPPTLLQDVKSELEMVDVAQQRITALGTERTHRYINHPLSHAVDQLPETAFISQEAAQQGDWIVLDLLNATYSPSACLEIAFLLDGATVDILRQCQFSISVDGKDWHRMGTSLNCMEINDSDPMRTEGNVRECGVNIMKPKFWSGEKVRSVRVSLQADYITTPWTVNEVWIRESPCI